MQCPSEVCLSFPGIFMSDYKSGELEDEKWGGCYAQGRESEKSGKG